jgi:hypothetical protein
VRFLIDMPLSPGLTNGMIPFMPSIWVFSGRRGIA